jgi:hypothetical protein
MLPAFLVSRDGVHNWHHEAHGVGPGWTHCPPTETPRDESRSLVSLSPRLEFPAHRGPCDVARPGAFLCRQVWIPLRTGARRAYLVLAYARRVGPPGPGGRGPGAVARPGASLCRHVWNSLRTGARRAYLVLADARWVGPPGPGGRVPGDTARPEAFLCRQVWISLRTGARRAYLVFVPATPAARPPTTKSSPTPDSPARTSPAPIPPSASATTR